MLTKLEWTVFKFVYVTSFKSFAATAFTWENGRMTVRTNRIPYYASWIILLLSLIYRYKILFQLIETSNFNGFVIHGIFLIAYTADVVCKLNFWFNSTEMTRLINEVQFVNSSWGNLYHYQFLFFILICVLMLICGIMSDVTQLID